MYAVIMAGGSGTRFWPASRRRRPKQFLDVTGRGPMVLETCDRLGSMVRDEETILVLGREHMAEAAQLFKGRSVHLLGEPLGRNTAACIGLGALYAAHLGCGEPIAFLPADHFIGDRTGFLKALSRAAGIAASGGIVTLGIVPTRPETGYGYIRKAEVLEDGGGDSVFRIAEFVEKPGPEKAREYLLSGDYFWNAGIFVAMPATVLQAIQEHLPGLSRGLERLAGALKAGTFEGELEAVYPGLETVSFDHGVMERLIRPGFVVPCACGWSDVGSWASLFELRENEQDAGHNLAEGDCVMVDCEGSFVSGRSGRLVACLGLKSCLVVDTPDALLVADLERSQDVRRIVEAIEAGGEKKDLL